MKNNSIFFKINPELHLDYKAVIKDERIDKTEDLTNYIKKRVRKAKLSKNNNNA